MVQNTDAEVKFTGDDYDTLLESVDPDDINALWDLTSD